MYKFINNRVEVRDSTERLEVDGKIYEGAKDSIEIMKCFQTVFAEEPALKEPEVEVERECMEDIKLEKQEVLTLMEEIDARKSMGPDGVTGWILK